MKKLILLFTIVITVCCIPVSYAKAECKVYDDVVVVKDGEELDFKISVIQDGSKKLVPLRSIFELYNISVGWDEKRSIITSTALGSCMLSIGSDLVIYGGSNYYWMETYARLHNGVTMIPVSFAEYCLGIKLNFIDVSNTLIIL